MIFELLVGTLRTGQDTTSNLAGNRDAQLDNAKLRALSARSWIRVFQRYTDSRRISSGSDRGERKSACSGAGRQLQRPLRGKGCGRFCWFWEFLRASPFKSACGRPRFRKPIRMAQRLREGSRLLYSRRTLLRWMPIAPGVLVNVFVLLKWAVSCCKSIGRQVPWRDVDRNLGATAVPRAAGSGSCSIVTLERKR